MIMIQEEAELLDRAKIGHSLSQLRQERNLCSHPRHAIPQPRRGGILCGARRSRRFNSRTSARAEIFQRLRQSAR